MPVAVGTNLSGPTVFDKFKTGALMGGTVGIVMGFLLGSVNIMRFGAGSSGVMRTLGNYMIGSGASFGFFMSIGSMIRSDTTSQHAIEAFARSNRQIIILPRSKYY
ncbi:Protein MGR2 [Erysiphe neolycopersici]|uniref:Protein MGR2 n=1 Tax=Erysiphe neolycopersici TaxID=212602 RepID=A0A420HT76_9PEZI|nr:Protein MGR2 [Erysiphe neolycopersici]